MPPQPLTHALQVDGDYKLSLPTRVPDLEIVLGASSLVLGILGVVGAISGIAVACNYIDNHYGAIWAWTSFVCSWLALLASCVCAGWVYSRKSTPGRFKGKDWF